jgi:DNA-binding NtrC family response regulator
MKQAKILIADDEAAITTGLSAILEDAGYSVDVVSDGQKALDALSAERYGVVLADLKMPKLDGLTLLGELLQRHIPTECIIITGQATVDSAVQAMQQGAYDYIEKPLNAEKLNRLKALIPKALDKYHVQQTNRELASKLEGLTHYAELTGQSESMRSVYQVIEAVAPSTASVLILGESGTGKELVARALHSKSDRAKGPFFALNCAALPKEILENELFGHEKGAFTGSISEKQGAFEMSSGGTIFLDEMAEMPPDIQVKLLRAIETRQIRRLGGKKEISVDIRILAATNKNLQKAIAEGELREDLYYRLAVVEIDLPPLRERADDIQLLANEFLGRFGQQNGKVITGFEDAAWEWIMSYHWPGNVRELKNAVERAVIMSRGTTIGPSDIIPRHLRNGGGMPAALTIPLGATAAEARQQLVLRTFASTSGDTGRTAKVLGLSEREVRGELLSLVTGEAAAEEPNVPRAVAKSPPVAAPARPVATKKKEPAPPPRPAAKKTTAKKGR